MFVAPNHAKNGDYYVNPCLFQFKDELEFQKGRKKSFLMKPKRQYHLSQWEECVYGTQSWNEKRLLCNQSLSKSTDEH